MSTYDDDLPCCGGLVSHKPRCRWYGTDRGTGRTTRLIERAIILTGEGCDIFITGAHSVSLRDLERMFRSAGLVGVRFLSPDQVARGDLRGQRGHLLIDDFDDLPLRHQEVLEQERCRLGAYCNVSHEAS